MTAASDSSAKIFEAQQEILADEEMDACVRELIEDEQLDPRLRSSRYMNNLPPSSLK